MTCKEFCNIFIDYRAGDFGPVVRRAVEAHLAACRRCGAYLWSYEETIRLAGDAFRHRDPAELECPPESLVRAILEARARARS